MNPGPAPAGDSELPTPPKPEDAKLASEPWTDLQAKQTVTNDFLRAQAHRSSNFDMRWNENDKLRAANVPQRFWDGTEVPRSSLGVGLVRQQLESLLPRVMEAMFTSVDGIFFDAYPLPATRPEQAMATRELMAHQLDEGGFKDAFRRSTKSGGLHGTGFFKMCWEYTEREKEIWTTGVVPRLLTLGGIPVGIGQQRQYKRQKYTEKINRPRWDYVSIRDIYQDPSCKDPRIYKAGFVIHRGFKNLDELCEMKKADKSYKGIPERAELERRVKLKAGPRKADADSNKQMASQEAGIFQAYPAMGSVDPAKYPFEVLEYWTKDRLVCLIDREFVARNIPNPYGFIPFYSITYTDILDEAYGEGLGIILDGDQRVQQGLINSWMDEISMNIHGQVVYQEGSVIGKHQLRPRPGGAIGVTGDVDKAIKKLERQSVLPDVPMALAASQTRAEQYTGITGMVVQGSPSTPSSASRTKFGIGTMAGAAFARIQYLVENIANDCVIPMLNDLDSLNKKFLDPSEAIQILGPSLGKEIVIDPMYVANGEYRFEMRAGSRMAARQTMQQSLPFMLQTIFNPALYQSMESQGIVPNFKAVMRDVFETMGFRYKGDWFRPVTPEEQQAKQQQAMMPEMMKLKKQEMQGDTKKEIVTQQQFGELVKLLIEKSSDQAPGAIPAALGSALEAVNQ
jgi:hypothetical protein